MMKGSLLMNTAPRIETAEISDTELDAVAGGLGVQADAGVGVMAGVGVGAAGVLAEVGAAGHAALGVGQFSQAQADVAV
jgi:hypothetical protein